MSRSRRRATAVLLLVASSLASLVAVTAPTGALVRARDNVAAFLTKRVGAPSASGPLEPYDPADPPVLRLAVAGDVGTGGEREWATARALDRVEEAGSVDALVLLGDNVYPDGDPKRVDETVFDPFAGVLDGGTTLLATLGNHDVQAEHGDAQAAALGMPGRWYATDLGDVLVVVLDSTQAGNAAQRQWLEATLASATERWKIVALHHPPYSSGWHGSSASVRRNLTPLFERFGVQLVLAGHEHDYQRTVAIDGVTYVVSGGAAKLRRTGRAEFTAAAWSTYHFLDVSVWADRLTVRAIDQDRRTFDTVTLRP